MSKTFTQMFEKTALPRDKKTRGRPWIYTEIENPADYRARLLKTAC